ncbi:MAG: hypothetical protein P8174_12280 [Gemmatimonadota bacterium]|jgi:cbb3-type cytochrome oxidase subunit 3
MIRTVIVALQVLVCLGLGYWAYRGGKKKEQALVRNLPVGQEATFR